MAVDTSTPVEVVAVARGELVLAQRAARRPRGRGLALGPAIAATLDEVGEDLGAVSAFGVVVGPGAFTGLRVAIATVQGMAAGLGAPAFALDAMDGWARALPGSARPVGVTLDARRGEVYSALFDTGGAGPRVLRELRLESPHTWAAELDAHCPDGVTLVGEGAWLYRGLPTDRLGPRAGLPGGSPQVPALGAAATRLAARVASGEQPQGPLRAIYLRDHDAAQRA